MAIQRRLCKRCDKADGTVPIPDMPGDYLCQECYDGWMARCGDRPVPAVRRDFASHTATGGDTTGQAGDFSLVKDQNYAIRGIWLRNPDEAHDVYFLTMLATRMTLEHGARFPREYVAAVLAKQYRVVPNTENEAGGCFVMFGGAPAPGEQGKARDRGGRVVDVGMHNLHNAKELERILQTREVPRPVDSQPLPLASRLFGWLSRWPLARAVPRPGSQAGAGASKCAKCRKRLWLPPLQTVHAYSGAAIRKLGSQMLARPFGCGRCGGHYCWECCRMAALEKGIDALVCPGCGSDLGPNR